MQKMLYETKYDCCGCSACYAACPVNAISMVTDDEGFKYPQVAQDKCVNCKVCETVCPLKEENHHSDPLSLYAAKNKNENVRANSSSGGVFSLLANYVESLNGVIYGAAFDENYKVLHMRAEKHPEWKKFCVSKYTQSDMNDVFSQVYQDLKNERLVLFSGTPCQVDGIQKYLKKKKVALDNLLTCDIVCHGTPSPRVWTDYVSYLKNSMNKEIGFISFRDKDTLGWHNSTLTFKDVEGTTIFSETKKDNYYFQLFGCGEILRPSCYKCHYASYHRPGDFTLGDFWGIERNFSDFDDDKGVSLVMVHTAKGEKVWNQIKENAVHFRINKDQCVQPNLVAPSEENAERDYFWYWYKKYGFKVVGQKRGYLPMTRVDKALLFGYRCFEKALRIIRRK